METAQVIWNSSMREELSKVGWHNQGMPRGQQQWGGGHVGPRVRVLMVMRFEKQGSGCGVKGAGFPGVLKVKNTAVKPA
jgi:hypothetical protein